MITANEIRIGNIVNHLYNTIQIESIFGDSVNVSAADMGGGPYIEGIDCKDIEPIQLTAGWLQNAGISGIEQNDGSFNFFRLPECQKGISSWLEYDSDRELCLHYGGYVRGLPLKHIHQLQNLFFALTGEELTIKELQP